MKLAINGGLKVREKLFPNQSTIGKEEIDAVVKVMKSTLLTGYKANKKGCAGGPQVQALEKEWKEYFEMTRGKWQQQTNQQKIIPDETSPHHPLLCVPVNSCTSGLFIACGAIGLQPGDEVIVTPYSMTCSATMPLAWGAVPVFADIEKDGTFNLCPKSVESKITEKTRAIIVVDLFGIPYNPEIDEIAKKYNLYVIEDAAQALGAMRYNEKVKCAGMLGHISVFSFNQGKHISAGEGGMICTTDALLEKKCRLLMNHAEAVINDGLVAPDGFNFNGMYGFNLRMTEIQAAIIREQLKKFDMLLEKRLCNVMHLENRLSKECPGVIIPHTWIGYYSSYYVLPIIFPNSIWPVHRDKVVEAIKAELSACEGREEEGVTIAAGYITPICDMPIFNMNETTSEIPNCRQAQSNELIIIHRVFGPNSTKADMDDVANAFIKVWENREEL